MTVWFQRWFESGERSVTVPLFEGETYEIEVYGKGGELLKREEILARREGIFLTLPKSKIKTMIKSQNLDKWHLIYNNKRIETYL